MALLLQGYTRAEPDVTAYVHPNQHVIVVSNFIAGNAYLLAKNRQPVEGTYESILNILGECYDKR